jgi:hypothetical protein
MGGENGLVLYSVTSGLQAHLGSSQSGNSGLHEHPGSDVITLNCDTNHNTSSHPSWGGTYCGIQPGTSCTAYQK